MPELTDNRAWNLLDDRIFRTVSPNGDSAMRTLPGVLASLLGEPDSIESFAGLAAEQQSHWYRFLVRCATRVLRDLDAAPSSLEGRSEELEGTIWEQLADAADSAQAWNLHAADLRSPAFLQAPSPNPPAPTDPRVVGYDKRGVSILTALLGSKNFERKSEAVRSLTPDELVYALVEFQGGVIFGGRGNYETQLTPSRSGKGSGVPFMGLRLAEGLAATFRRDVRVFLDAQPRIRKNLHLNGDIWALWTVPWDGERPLPSHRLDPCFIPLARLVRTGAPDDDERFRVVWFRASKASRVEDLSGGALLGDPFTPTIPHPKSERSRKVRGVMEVGFPYPEVAELLGLGERGCRPSDTVAAFLEESGTEETTGVDLVLEGLAFEQGKTLGYHRRVAALPVTGRGLDIFSDPDPLREAHGFMLETVREAKSILRAAARLMASGSSRPRVGDEAVAEIPVKTLDAFAEHQDAYLRYLFKNGMRQRRGDLSWQTEWKEWVSDRARAAFLEALPEIVTPGAQRIRREAGALNFLEAKLWVLRGGVRGDREAIDHTDEPNEEEDVA